MIAHLQTHYTFSDLLLCVSKDFIGYNPTFSRTLHFERPEEIMEFTKTEDFEMNGVPFTASLTQALYHGPLRGFRRIKIARDGTKMIDFETGARPFGLGYSEGSPLFMEGNTAYLTIEGNALRNVETGAWYAGLRGTDVCLFCFENAVISANKPIRPGTENVSMAGIRTREEVEALFQTDREAELTIDDTTLHIAQSVIPDFQREALWRDAPTTAQKYGGLIDFRKVVISWNGITLSDRWRSSRL